MTLSGMPICKCPEQCSLDHLGLAAEMITCGSDGNTYDSICDLQQFACIHQLDVVPTELGTCLQGNNCFVVIQMPIVRKRIQ